MNVSGLPTGWTELNAQHEHLFFVNLISTQEQDSLILVKVISESLELREQVNSQLLIVKDIQGLPTKIMSLQNLYTTL